MNQDAGRRNWLFVTLRLDSGEELPFFVDSGTPVTFFDKSLEPRLGKCLGITKFSKFGAKGKTGIYAAPKLYLGGTRLITGNHVYCHDFKELLQNAGRPVMGILGMDCLCHYCIQLDFAAGKIRFLDPDQVNGGSLGTAFPLMLKGHLPFIHTVSLLEGEETSLLIDTGFNADGLLRAPRSWRESRGNGDLSISTNSAAASGSNFREQLKFPNSIWHGNTYTNLIVIELPTQYPNLIGLRFLARHLVTLDFPKRILYLKQTSVGPIAGDRFLDNGLTNGSNGATPIKGRRGQP